MIDDSKKPLLFTLLVAGVAFAVSAPLAFIVGAFVTIVTGTIHETVGASGDIIYGVVAALLTTLLVVLYASYATYNFSKAKYVDGTVE